MADQVLGPVALVARHGCEVLVRGRGLRPYLVGSVKLLEILRIRSVFVADIVVADLTPILEDIQSLLQDIKGCLEVILLIRLLNLLKVNRVVAAARAEEQLAEVLYFLGLLFFRLDAEVGDRLHASVHRLHGHVAR